MPYANAQGAELWYEDTGGDGPVIVLVHGVVGNSACWEQQVPAFTAGGCRVITWDLRGFGRSLAQPGMETAGAIADDIEALATHLRLFPFFLVAQAYGAFGALEFALDSPYRLRGLVVSTSFGGLTDPEFTALRSKYVPADLGERPVEERELGETYRETNPDGVRRFLEMDATNPRHPPPRQALRRPQTLARLETMRVPALVIAADEDVYAPPPVMRAMADRIPGSRFEVITGAGHCAYWEQPEVWNRKVLDFVEAVPKPGGP
jgi:pimeloyl-ACP methyl ester carboxylesterase